MKQLLGQNLNWSGVDQNTGETVRGAYEDLIERPEIVSLKQKDTWIGQKYLFRKAVKKTADLLDSHLEADDESGRVGMVFLAGLNDEDEARSWIAFADRSAGFGSARSDLLSCLQGVSKDIRVYLNDNCEIEICCKMDDSSFIGHLYFVKEEDRHLMDPSGSVYRPLLDKGWRMNDLSLGFMENFTDLVVNGWTEESTGQYW